MNTLQTIPLQLAAIDEFFDHLQSRDNRLQYEVNDNAETAGLIETSLSFKVA
jgi:hypothetical protein